ncbi:hypothetical protein PFICI_14768 [Pestalotiopsis fici W106-1]|uniref:Fungal STAND N-terminal Goodbye domain-containing protein n=1 Tax=Pestalotiopsis fici (strain W106-1 / CGMCC3.15140) TaxID=1229662 RepID=W3WL00_PESFW|nr:uncharacterized protein PFICI_14768 [Pestalotiopsis fici W106-1]ETS73822.1 hypothetical protein PFICI_14768 [Pestalotiopsis fici W106-1]
MTTELSDRSEYLNSRPRHPPSEAIRFVETRMVVAGQPDAVYCESLDTYVSVPEAKKQDQISAELWKQADSEMEKLFELLEKVQVKLSKKGMQQSPQSIRSCRWEDVLSQVQDTAAQWSTTPNRTSQAMLCISKVGRNSAVFESWLGLLPDGDYGASLCGVFKLAIGAAGRYVKIEEAVFSALADIPEIIQGAQNYVRIYAGRQDQLLERKTFDLFLAVLRALTHIMQFFADGGLKKTMQSTLKQSAYKAELIESINEIRRQASRIKEEADQCLAWAVRDSNLAIKDVKQTGNEVLKALQRLLEESIPARHEYTASQLEAMNSRLGVLEQRSSLMIESGPTDRINQTTNAASFARNANSRPSVEDMTKFAHSILDAIRYDPNVIERDLERSVGIGERLEEGEKARAAAMIRHSEYKAMMVETSASTSLLVNGRKDLAAAESISSLTYVAGSLVRASRDAGSIYLMAYFCDFHRPSFEPSTEASSFGIVASFAGQLLSQMLHRDVQMDLSFFETRDWHRHANMKLDTLWKLLRQLISQLPEESVLICVIDEITRYETSALYQDTEKVVRRLTRLVGNSESIVFKLLLTCHDRALGVSQYFKGCTIDLDAEAEPDDSSAWWMRSAQRQGA